MSRRIFQSTHKRTPHPSQTSSAGDTPSPSKTASEPTRKPKFSFLDRLTSKTDVSTPNTHYYDSDEYSKRSSYLERLPDTITQSIPPSSPLRVAPARPVAQVTLQPIRPLVITKRSQSPLSGRTNSDQQHSQHHSVMSAIEAEKLNVHAVLLDISSRPLPPLPSEGEDVKMSLGRHIYPQIQHSQSRMTSLQSGSTAGDANTACDCRVCSRQRSQTTNAPTEVH